MSSKVYRYTALDSQGKASHGTIEAATEEQAMTLLARKDLVVQEIREVMREEPSRPLPRAGVSEGGVPADQLASFAYELSALLSSGVKLAQALELQVKDRTRGKMDPVVLDLLRQVRAGTPLSLAIESHPGVFPPIFPALVRAGEGTGNIDKALAQLSDFFERIDKVKNHILSAVSYPAVVSGMALVIITALFIFMVPRFNQIYQQIGVPVPPVTRLVLDLGEYADEAVLVLILGVALGLPVLRRVLSTPAGRLSADRLKLRVPVIGGVFRLMALANFCKTLALLQRNGVLLPAAVQMAAAASGNAQIRATFEGPVRALREGRSLSSALASTGLFSEKMLGMLEAGEKSGTLSDMLIKMAEFIENRTEHRVTRAMALLEPLTISFIGLLVGTAVITLAAPLMSISAAIRTQ